MRASAAIRPVLQAWLDLGKPNSNNGATSAAASMAAYIKMIKVYAFVSWLSTAPAVPDMPPAFAAVALARSQDGETHAHDSLPRVVAALCLDVEGDNATGSAGWERVVQVVSTEFLLQVAPHLVATPSKPSLPLPQGVRFAEACSDNAQATVEACSLPQPGLTVATRGWVGGGAYTMSCTRHNLG